MSLTSEGTWAIMRRMVLLSRRWSFPHLSWGPLAVVLSFGCSAGDGEGITVTFGDPTQSATTTATTASTATADSQDDDDDGPSPTTSSDESATETVGDDTMGDDTESNGPSEQPATGMYSACLDVSMCVGQNACFTITEGMDVVDGFCTTVPCSDPTNCNPSPGGTATPVCAEMLVGGSPTTGCALDCSQGKTCPAGMQCYTLATGEVCA
jgi:hypothetical protein